MLKLRKQIMSFLLYLLQIFIPLSDQEREAWVAKKLAKIPKGSKILDAGAGEGRYRKYCHHLQYISQDLSQYDGIGNGQGIKGKQSNFSKIDIISDIVGIPVKDGSFDAVLCVEVFEHLPEPLLALKELNRVLKKDGVLILTAPFTSLTHYSPYFFYSGFSINFYTKNLPLYGFKIDEVYAYGNYFSYLALELLRVPLVCWRMKKMVFFLFLPLFPFLLLPYLFLFFLSKLIPSSRELLCFGYCLRARKA